MEELKQKPFGNIPLWISGIIFVLLSFGVFGRSISYDFVYDDVWRIQNNPHLEYISHPLRFFKDRETQSAVPSLNNDTYRPLLSLNFALDRYLWGETPAGFRVFNIFFHGLNAFIIFCLARTIFTLSKSASFFAGIFFLTHPTQVESVVWIVERSNIMALFFMLSALWCWNNYRESQRHLWLMGVYFQMVLALLYRENAVCLPFLIFLVDRVYKRKNVHGALSTWIHSALLLGLGVIFFLIRLKILGQIAQTNYWGGSYYHNLFNVIRIFPEYIKAVYFPYPLLNHYIFNTTAGFFERQTFIGLLLLSLCLVIIGMGWKRVPRLSLCLSLFLVFWIPTSGIVPLAEQYSNRFIYPLLVFMGWACGLVIDATNASLRRIGVCVLLGFLLGYNIMTQFYINVWKSEITLWQYTVLYSPHDSFSWFCLGLAQEDKSSKESEFGAKRHWLDQAEISYRNALHERVRTDYAGEVFLRLARINFQQGKMELAEAHAKRGLILRPDLTDWWPPK